MNINRRSFLKGAAVGTAAAATCSASVAEAAPFVREPLRMPENAVGMLYDSTLCIGCKACVTACKVANDMPVEIPSHLSGWNEKTWDTAETLGRHTLNVIKVYQHGTMETKDAEENGHAFVKRHCLHCVDASCVSVCPVGAMHKDQETGWVSHDPDRCIGCRYCVLGCPFGIPRYQYDDPFGQIVKCQFCNHLQKKGEMPACCDVCPTGASLFGLVKDLQAEADKRLQLKPGEAYLYPRGRLGEDRPGHEKPAPTYIQDVYGQHEVGSTQVRYLSAVSFEKLGLPTLPDDAFSAISEGVQGTLYKGMIAPGVLLGGLLYFAYRSSKQQGEDEY